MAYSQPTEPGSQAFAQTAMASRSLNGGGRIAEVRDKDVTYNATVSEQILNISTDPDTTTTREAIPSRIDIANVGSAPIYVLAGYKTYSSETAVDDSSQTRYLHTLLMPGETYNPPVRSIISTANASTLLDGTALSNETPNSLMYTSSGTTVNAGEGGDHVINSATATNLWLPEGDWTSATNGAHLRFRPKDLIRVNNEVMEVTAVGSGADGTNNNYLTVRRGQYGSTAATHTAGNAITFPFFNANHDFDRYTVAQTDNNGEFKCFNFFGVGRTATGVQGVLAGSVAFKFFTNGYHSCGMSGITSSTNSGLTASTAYEFDIQVDGGTNFDNLSFTTDSSNLNFGGTNGVVSKIQAELDEQYYTAGNLFEKKVTVGIIGGDLRFTSGSRLSTSAIALTAGSTGTAEFFGTGRIPAIGTSAGNPRVPDAVPARLQDDVVYDPINYLAKPNTGIFGRDSGSGRIFGICGGTINYETGALGLKGCPPNAEFVYTVAHTSVFSGMATDITAARFNCLIEVLANTPSQKGNGRVRVTQYK